MVRVFVRHKVEDYAAWRVVYDDFDNQRRAIGVTGDEVFQSVDDPNEVTSGTTLTVKTRLAPSPRQMSFEAR